MINVSNRRVYKWNIYKARGNSQIRILQYLEFT